MNQANYKTLLLKLIGTAVGLVVMLTLAANVGQRILADKLEITENSAGTSYGEVKRYAPRYVTLDRTRLEAARQKHKLHLLETGKLENINELAMESAKRLRRCPRYPRSRRCRG